VSPDELEAVETAELSEEEFDDNSGERAGEGMSGGRLLGKEGEELTMG
jgi:hypothetical protein